jgi:hypothetical protein
MTTRRALCGVLLALAGCRRGADAAPTPASDVDVASLRARLRCNEPSSLGRSTRTETCRLMADFAAGGAFTQLPAPGTESVWFGREFQAQPTQESDVTSWASFIVLHLRHGAPPAETMRDYGLAPAAVVPVLAEDLVLLRFANPTTSVGGVERARDEFNRLTTLAAALEQGQSPSLEASAWVRALRDDEGHGVSMRGPVATSRSRGRSLVLRGALPNRYSTGWYLRMAADGRRALLLEGNDAAELWRLP